MEIIEKIPFSKEFLYEKENFKNEFSFQSILNIKKKIKSDEERKKGMYEILDPVDWD